MDTRCRCVWKQMGWGEGAHDFGFWCAGSSKEPPSTSTSSSLAMCQPKARQSSRCACCRSFENAGHICLKRRCRALHAGAQSQHREHTYRVYRVHKRCCNQQEGLSYVVKFAQLGAVAPAGFLEDLPERRARLCDGRTSYR